jgi:hypothetical protein
MIKEATRDKPGFLEHSKPYARTGGGSQVFREQCAGFIRKLFASPIFVALGDETDMETIDTNITLDRCCR